MIKRLKTQASEIKNQITTALRAIHAKKSKLKTKPWILLIGKQGAGKTSLLAKSQHKFTSPFGKSIEKIHNTKNIDWWISETGIFIDPAGTFCFSTETEAESYRYWQDFLKILQKKVDHPFDTVCLVIDLPSLIHHQDMHFDDFIKRWQTQIRLLSSLCSPLCLNIVITHCDHLAGYAEFFSSLDTEQQKQSFGFSLVDADQESHIQERFIRQFRAFLSMINHRVLDRLYYEPNNEKKLRMHDFPLQLEGLEHPLAELIAALPDAEPIAINNIFFCSSAQTIKTINLFGEHLNHAFHFKKTTETPLIAEERALFLHKMIPRLAETSIKTTQKKATPVRWWHYAGYPIAIGLIALLITLFHHSYRESLATLSAVQENLTESNSQPNWLSELTHLRKAKFSVEKPSNHFFGFSEITQLKKQIQHQYDWRLKHELIPYLNRAVENKVEDDTKNNSPQLYQSLSIYLSFAKANIRDNAVIQQWFAKHWKKQFPNDPKFQKSLTLYLQDILQKKSFSWGQNQAVIRKAKAALQKEPFADIAFKILRENNYGKIHSLQKNIAIDGLDLSHTHIADFYTTENFSTIYNKTIPEFSNSLFKTSWVLNPNKQNPLSSAELTKQLRQIYVQQYLAQWQKNLAEISFHPPATLTEAMQQTNLLTNRNSPLWQLYQNAITTANHAGASSYVRLIISENKQTLPSNLLDSDQENAAMKSLNQLHDYLKQINESPSSIKASYDAALKRFTDKNPQDAITLTLSLAQTLPDPMRHWLNTLAVNDWQLILNNTSTFLDTLWQTEVMPAYHKTIENRFPVYKDAKEDISIENFNAFFGPGGIMQDYFNHHVKPFVDMSQTYWSWKMLDGKKINAPQANLDRLIRASMIQQMFYTNNQHMPSIGFTLTPVSMSDDIRQFSLNISGQSIYALPGIKKSDALIWPGPDGSFVTMRIDYGAKKSPTLTTMGPWAWLRLLTLSEIQSSNDPRQFQVTFKLANKQVVYQLIADNPINPYLPHILTEFRCRDIPKQQANN